MRYSLKSRFFEELPQGALKWLTPQVSGYGTGYTQQYKNAWARQSVAVQDVGEVPAFAKPKESHGWRMGQSVRHAKFGEGVIVNLEGTGTDARAQINFGGQGMKWLALSVARLERV